jgi:PIN domain nuclease of toxin-antitoxin system
LLHLDTHAFLYLYAGDLARLGEKGRALVKTEDLFISGIVVLELHFLYEIQRIQIKPGLMIQALQKQNDLHISQCSCADIADKAAHLTWTRDPFDRMIVADALLGKAPLLSKDRLIQEHYPKAVW